MTEQQSTVDSMLPIPKLFAYGLQHVLAMYAGAVAVPIIIAQAMHLPVDDLIRLITADLFTCGIATLIQTLGFGNIGGRIPMIQGVTFAAVGPMAMIGAQHGMPAIYGAIIVAGLFTFLIAPFFSRLIRLFPPVVTGSIITIIGINLMPVAVNWLGGFAMLCGLAFGLLIERAQICFTSAFRDLWVTGRAYMAKAIIFGILAGTIGVFSYIQLGVAPKIMWAGPNAIIGGLLFGFGIVLAGGCETGWMYRSMEGQVHFMWVGVGNVIGSTYLAYAWDGLAPVLALDYEKLNLLKEFGAVGGLLVNYGLLILCLIAVIWWEKRFLAKAKAKIAAVAQA